ncbi:MAG: formylmethanofuran dehydrogenase subunit E family protein [Candidatus Njordarchaeia archaeon]|nr:formylmethanofuran dehydrogenase subunit E family protein [Candidatus Korarchaeota archaeon]
MDGSIQELAEFTKKFHGHLGPFAALGLRMGLLALRKLNSPGYFDLNVIVKTGLKTPLSCIVDGIQVSTGCTLGKGNITVIDESTPEAIFTTKSGKKITIRVKEGIIKKIEQVSGADMEKSAMEILNENHEKLFIIS